MQHLQPNSTLQGGKYKIEKVLGQGGFGITYLAENTLYGTKVAIKEFFYSKECTRDYSTSRVITMGDTELFEVLKRKFLKEANTLMSFNHPNIVRVYDCFEENGTAYYSMDYIDGIALDEYLKKKGVLSERAAVATIRRVAAALQYVHGRHYNHFDVKPANIFLRRSDNEVLLIDFGASKHYDSNTGSATTLSNACYSPGYAPIEQYNQGGVSTFTPETDIYSLGATLYKMLTSQTPPEPSVMIESGLPAMPSWISQSTKSAITAAMQINKQNRPHSISEFLNILDGDEATKVVDESTMVYTNTHTRTNTATTSNQPSSNASHNSGGTSWGWLVAILIAVVGGVVLYNSSNKNVETSGQSNIVENNNVVSSSKTNTTDVKANTTDVDVLVNMFLKSMRGNNVGAWDLYSEIDGIQEIEPVSPDNSGYSASYGVKLTANGDYLNKNGSSRSWKAILSGPHYGANILKLESGEINDLYKDKMKTSVANSLKGNAVKSNSGGYYEYTLYKNSYGYYAVLFDWGASAMWMSIYASTDIGVLNQVLSQF